MSGKQERHGPDGPLNDLTGKAIVNDGLNDRPDDEPNDGPDDGPDDELNDGPDDEPDDGPDERDEPGTDDGLGTSDELALRRMLRGAVEELEPSRDALEHLRKAVPARRARRRQAIVGMAAAALFVGTAVPAFVHVANSGGAADDNPSIAGHGRDTHGGTGWQKDVEGGKKVVEKPSGKATSSDDKKKQKEKGKQKDPEKSSSSTGRSRGTGGGADAPDSVPALTPTCGASQLTVVSAGAGAPDAEGKVYGTFRISNVSAMRCSVAGSGQWGFQAMGAADYGRITVVDHTSGDAATGLPDPSMETTGLLLEPGMAYEVKFAWVPTESCPTTNPSPDPTPTEEPGPGPGPTDGSGTGDNGGGAVGGTGESGPEQAGMEPQLVTEDGGTADGSVSVSHTPEAGGPSATTTIPNACAGTIYRTGVLQAQ